MPAVLRNTTLGAAMAASGPSATTFKIATTTGVLVGMVGFCEQEAFLVTEIDLVSGVGKCVRGWGGTVQAGHASGRLVYIDKPEYFRQSPPYGTAAGTDYPVTPVIDIVGAKAYRVLQDSWVEVPTQRVQNAYAYDPDTGYEYLLCDTDASKVTGEWVVISADDLAARIGAASKGRVGIVVEDVASSDTLTWVIVSGTYASALTTSDVTTAADLIAGTGAAEVLTSTGGNIIWGAACTVAPSTATSPTLGGGVATVYLHRPWVSGEVHSFSSVGT